MSKPLCKNCPDHEACMTGFSCYAVKRLAKNPNKEYRVSWLDKIKARIFIRRNW